MKPDDLMVPAGVVRDLTPDEIAAALNDDPEVTAISDYLMGALDAEEAAAVARRLEEDEGFRQRVEPIVRAWRAWPGPTDFVQDGEATAARWRRVVALADEARAKEWERDEAWRTRGSAPRQGGTLWQLRAWQVATVLMVVVGLPLAGWAGATLSTRRSAPRLLVDEASSRESKLVRVGPNSWASIAANARLVHQDRPDERGRRELYLNGDASFLLTQVQAGEYVVITPAARVLVTGTNFDVRMPDPATTLVTVREGRVLLESRGVPSTTEPLILGPGEQGRAVWGAAPRRAR